MRLTSNREKSPPYAANLKRGAFSKYSSKVLKPSVGGSIPLESQEILHNNINKQILPQEITQKITIQQQLDESFSPPKTIDSFSQSVFERQEKEDEDKNKKISQNEIVELKGGLENDLPSENTKIIVEVSNSRYSSTTEFKDKHPSKIVKREEVQLQDKIQNSQLKEISNENNQILNENHDFKQILNHDDDEISHIELNQVESVKLQHLNSNQIEEKVKSDEIISEFNLLRKNQIIQREQISTLKAQISQEEEELRLIMKDYELFLEKKNQSAKIIAFETQTLAVKSEILSEEAERSVEIDLENIYYKKLIFKRLEDMKDKIRVLENENELQIAEKKRDIQRAKNQQTDFVFAIQQYVERLNKKKDLETAKEAASVLIEQSSNELYSMLEQKNDLVHQAQRLSSSELTVSTVIQALTGLTLSEIQLENTSYTSITMQQNMLIESLQKRIALLSQFSESQTQSKPANFSKSINSFPFLSQNKISQTISDTLDEQIQDLEIKYAQQIIKNQPSNTERRH